MCKQPCGWAPLSYLLATDVRQQELRFMHSCCVLPSPPPPALELRSERCGSCENCLNPQRKKACIVARQRLEQQMMQSAPSAGAAGTKASMAPAAAAAAAAADDPLTRSLTAILSGSGGVAQERHVPALLQLVKRARNRPHRTALLAVLQLSAPAVLHAAVEGGVLLDLQMWLGEFVAEGKQAMVQRMLGCLDKLPVTLASLQPPCELGRAVGRLRKHEAFGSAVIEPAKRLVARWKSMVDQAARTGAAGSSGRSGLLSHALSAQWLLWRGLPLSLKVGSNPCRRADGLVTLCGQLMHMHPAGCNQGNSEELAKLAV